jgi:hypothetical protein
MTMGRDVSRSIVMPGLVPGIHAVTSQLAERPMEWTPRIKSGGDEGEVWG